MCVKNTNVSICNSASLTIKEHRQSSTKYESEDGFQKVTKNTATFFSWMITTIASKISIDDLDDDNKKEQEVYTVAFKSNGYDYGISRFKTRKGAIKNALEFSSRNGIELDGYDHD